jgi:hypothetical protein
MANVVPQGESVTILTFWAKKCQLIADFPYKFALGYVRLANFSMSALFVSTKSLAVEDRG